MHAFLSNLANRQIDKRTRAKYVPAPLSEVITRSVAAGFGRHGMLPPACNDRYSILFPEWRRDRDETYIRVRRSLDTDSIKTLVHAFVMLRVDYCNAVFAVSRDILLISVWRSETHGRFSADHGVYCQCQCISEHMISSAMWQLPFVSKSGSN